MSTNVVSKTDTGEELILVADDEQDIRSLLRILLEKEGWQVAEACDGAEAVAFVKAHPHVSLVVLDIMMPKMDGIETAAALRDMTAAPILFLTARSSDSDKMAAYRNGGDDYIVKPFHATDLRLKLRAMLARYRLYQSRIQEPPVREGSSNVIHLSESIEAHLDEKNVLKNGERVVLTEREYELLRYFCLHRGETLTPAVLYEAIWGEPYLNTASNTVIVHIANLRKKLEQDPAGPSFIRTVWGKGYRLD